MWEAPARRRCRELLGGTEDDLPPPTSVSLCRRLLRLPVPLGRPRSSDTRSSEPLRLSFPLPFPPSFPFPFPLSLASPCRQDATGTAGVITEWVRLRRRGSTAFTFGFAFAGESSPILFFFSPLFFFPL